MDRKKNNKGIYNAFLYGAIGYAVVAVMFMAVGGWYTAIAYLYTTIICACAWISVKRLSSDNEDMADMLTWRDPNVELPDPDKYDWVLIKVQYSDGFIGIPQIGEFRSDGYWHSESYDDIVKFGESFEIMCGCKVIGWKPIE